MKCIYELKFTYLKVDLLIKRPQYKSIILKKSWKSTHYVWIVINKVLKIYVFGLHYLLYIFQQEK